MSISFKHAKTVAKADGVDGTLVQPSDWNAEHTITLAADKLLGRSSSGSGSVEEVTCTATGRALIAAASTSAARTALGTAIGTDVQAYDAKLAALVAAAWAAGKFPYFGGASSVLLGDVTTFALALLTCVDATAWRTNLGTVLHGTSGASAGLLNEDKTDSANNVFSGQNNFTNAVGLLAKNTSKAYARVYIGAAAPTNGAVSLLQSFNVSSVINNGDGTYTVTLAGGMSNSNYQVQVSGSEATTIWACPTILSTTQFKIHGKVATSGSNVVAANEFSFSVWGT